MADQVEHEHVFEPVIRRVPPGAISAFEIITAWRCRCGEPQPRDPRMFDPLANAQAALRYVRERSRRAVAPWQPPGWNPWSALRTPEDYEACARGASPAVRHVKVRSAKTDSRMMLFDVEVRVRGRWRRRLKAEELQRVRAAIAAHNPTMVRLRVRS